MGWRLFHGVSLHTLSFSLQCCKREGREREREGEREWREREGEGEGGGEGGREGGGKGEGAGGEGRGEGEEFVHAVVRQDYTKTSLRQ